MTIFVEAPPIADPDTEQEAPIAPQEAPSPPIQGDICELCGTFAIFMCDYCARFLCVFHTRRVHHWCQLEFTACPDCYTQKLKEKL